MALLLRGSKWWLFQSFCCVCCTLRRIFGWITWNGAVLVPFFPFMERYWCTYFYPSNPMDGYVGPLSSLCREVLNLSIHDAVVSFQMVYVFYADAMCSLSKVFFDWGMLLHQASHYPNAVPAAAHNIILPSMCAAVPYVIRARQCLIMHTVGRIQQDPKRYQHLMNAFKYSTSIFPLILSAYQKTLSDAEAAAKWETTLIVLLV
jgi:hypothetical protein